MRWFRRKNPPPEPATEEQTTYSEWSWSGLIGHAANSILRAQGVIVEASRRVVRAHEASERSATQLGKRIEKLNRWLLAFTVAIWALTVVLVLVELGVMRRREERVTKATWVLWEDTFVSTNRILTEPVRAYTTKQDCDGALFEVLATFRSSPGQIVQKDTKRQQAFVTVGKSTTGYRYICLPDTVDPRGPKGK